MVNHFLYFAYGSNVNKEFLSKLLGYPVQEVGISLLRAVSLGLVGDEECWLGLVEGKGYALGRLYLLPNESRAILDEYEDEGKYYQVRFLEDKRFGFCLLDESLDAVLVYFAFGFNCQGKVSREYKKLVLDGMKDIPNQWRDYVGSLLDAHSV